MQPTTFRFASYTLIPRDQLLLRGSQPVPFAPKLFDLLAYMVEHRGRLLTREELMKAVWADTVVEEGNLTVNISLLRKALGDAPNGKPYIETVPRRGYRFQAEFVEVDPGEMADAGAAAGDSSDAAPPVAAAAAAPAAQPTPAPAKAAAQPTHRRRDRQRAVFVGLALVLGIAVAWIARSGFSTYQARQRAAASPLNLAVLPFRNLKPSGDDDFLGFAMADAIITRLGYFSRLSVRPSSAVAGYDPAALELARVARDLKVDRLLTGTYVHEGRDLRLSAQLIDAGSQRLLWSDSVSFDYQNLIDVQDRVAQELLARLQIPLSVPEATRLAERHHAKSDAYEEYLKGVNAYAMDQFEDSIRDLEAAAHLDPDYAPTWAMLGRAYTTNASLRFGGARDYAQALAAYQTALRLDPVQIVPRVYMANLFTDTGRVEEAVPLLREALQVNPNHAEALWELSYAYRFAGLLEASVATAERARQIDSSVKINSSAINAYLYLGSYQQFLDSLPGQNTSAYVLFYRGYAEYHLGRRADAQRDFDRAYELDPDLLQPEVGKALSYAISSEQRRGIEFLRGVEAQLVERGVTDAEGIYKVAQAYAQLGDDNAALRVLKTSIDGGFFCYPYIRRDPLLEPVRKSEEFASSLEAARARFDRFRAGFDRQQPQSPLPAGKSAANAPVDLPGPAAPSGQRGFN